MQPNYKHPSKGNPHNITINQHIHAKQFIKKFMGHDGKVELYELKPERKDLRMARPADSVFCAKRKWDQKTESRFCTRIEGEFSLEIEKIIAGGGIENRDHKIISEYYCLWNVRKFLSLQDTPNFSIKNIIKLSVYRSDADREMLEKAGIMSFNNQHEMEAHFLNSTRLIRNVDIELKKMLDVKWCAIRTNGPEFICSDAYPNIAFMPISPTIALIEGFSDTEANILEVAEYNRISILESDKFYFCNSKKKCPLPKNRIRNFPFEIPSWPSLL